MSENYSKILAVDDNPQNIKVIGSILRKANYQVGFAFNGKQALELLKESNDYDLVLLDVNMPVMNGYETCVQIRKNLLLKEVPIIFLTALSETDNIVRGLDSGAQDYIAKPFNGRELLARVQTHIELKKSKEKLKEMNSWLEAKVNERTQELKEANENLEEVNRKLEKTNRELESLDEAKVDFLRILSHEINTPLNGIIGFTSMLKEEVKEPEFHDMLHFLDISAKRLEKFANVSLLITELKTKQKRIEMEKVDVSSVLEDIFLETFKEKFEDKEVHLFTKLKDKIICADRKMLKIVFESLLDNAIVFSPNKGKVTVSSYKKDGRIYCDFSDTGKGFSQEVLENPFKLFNYGKDEYADEKKGLSLALVKLIVDAHQGEVELQNTKEGGALVRLVFKQKKAAAAND